MPWNRVWVGPTLFLLAACSSTSKIRGLDDAGADGQGGSAGNAQGGSSGSGSGGSAGGNAGTGALGAGGSAGSNAGNGGSSGSDAGSGGSGAAGSAGSGSSGGTSGGAGTGGTSGCTLEEATVDFAAQGNVTRMRFDQRGVAVIGIADLKLSDHSAAEPDAGLGVVGGWFDWSIDTTEFVTFSFTRPAANVKILVTHALDINKDDVYGKSTVTGYDANGQQIDHFEIAGPGEKNLSALFGGVTLSKVMIKSDADGIAIGTLTFVACLD